MKTILKLAICFFILQISYAQTTLTDYFIISGERIEVEILKTDGNYKIKLSKEGTTDPEEFNIGSSVGSFFDFKKQFRSKVYVALLGLTMPPANTTNNILQRIDEEAESIYYSFANNLRVLDNLDYKPNTGILKVNDRIPIYLSKDHMEEFMETFQEEVAKIEFEKMMYDLQTALENVNEVNINDITNLVAYTHIPKIQAITESQETDKDKATEIKKYGNELSPNSETYIELQEVFIQKYSELQYIPNDAKKVALTYFIVDNVEFEFYKGFLEIIKVSGSFDCVKNDKFNCKFLPSFLKLDAKILFTNKYGIGFTSRDNYRKLENVSLSLNQVDKKFTNNNFENLTRDSEIYNMKLKSRMYLLMDDLINYNFNVNKLTRDFSPMDQRVVVEGGKKLTLTKEETRKILEMEVYSDFQGFDAESPNGLIQMELSKHFNINTQRRDGWLIEGFGLVQYTEIAGGITKIEDKERRLNPERIDTEQTLEDNSIVLNSKRYTTPINLLNYSSWYFGQDVNFLLIDNPDLKHQFHINGGFRFSRTPIQDTLKTIGSTQLKPEEYSVSYWTFYPEIKMHLLPEERYGFYAMWRPKYVHLISDRIEFQSVSDPVTGFKRRLSNWVNEFEFKGYVDVGSKGQLFLRWRLNHEMGYSANNFSQIQLGYSFFIFGRNESESINP